MWARAGADVDDRLFPSSLAEALDSSPEREWKMPNEHDHPFPDDDHQGPPDGRGREPADPAWADVIGGIWDRFTHPLPR